MSHTHHVPDDSRPELDALAKRLPDVILHALELVKYWPELADEEELDRFLSAFRAELAAALDHDHEALVALGFKSHRRRQPLSKGARALRKATAALTRQLRHVMGLRRKLMVRDAAAATKRALEEEDEEEGQAPAALQ